MPQQLALHTDRNDQAGSGLFLYNQACAAIAAALNTDEILEIDSRAEAIRAYAKKAANRELEVQAAEIRIRALRRLGQLLHAIKLQGKVEPTESISPLSARKFRRILAADLGVNQNLAIKAMKAADIATDDFEKLIVAWRHRCAEENKIYLTLEPRLTPKEQDAYRHPIFGTDSRPNDLLHRFCCPGQFHVSDGCSYFDSSQPVAYMPVLRLHEIRIHLHDQRQALEWTQKFIENIINHFGGGFAAFGEDVNLRDVLSNSKLAALIKQTSIETGIGIEE